MRIDFKRILLVILIFLPSISQNQETGSTQTIRGKAIDKDSGIPLIGANITVLRDSTIVGGAASDEEGYYRIDGIPVGRYRLVVSCLGYGEVALNDIILTSAKEVILDVKLEESATRLEEVEIVASTKHEALNKMATVSTRTFSVEESERYAGSRGDPARMASNFAGCQGADDSRNDIIVRGNSPLGILWRLEGIDIPSPNHFSISGSVGGPVSIINNKMLANSDFYTGAFPAEFGNSIAGVFDLKMRNGNNEKHEITAQLGFLGTELTAEGPISKKNHSSYLVNYRYSTLALFGFLGINIGTSAVPKYQDASLKLNFPCKKGGNISIFGIGGLSDIDILISKQKANDVEIYGETDRDQYFITRMGVAGLSYTKPKNATTFAKVTIATTAEQQLADHRLIYRQQDSLGYNLIDNEGYYLMDSIVDKLKFNFRIQKFPLHVYVQKKINTKHLLKAGMTAEYHMYSFVDSIYNNGTTYDWTTRWDYTGSAFLLQPYLQWRYKITEKLVLNAGLHLQYFSLNWDVSGPEPRIGLKWFFRPKQVLSLGVGMHSQLQPLYTYFYRIPDADGNYHEHNMDMGYTKSRHYILGYDVLFTQNLRLKAEAYYQQLSEIPVDRKSSSNSLVNMGSGFSRFFPDSLVNEGTAKNYGLELTIEKFFSTSFFFMVTGSLYQSKYKGSDNILRDTDYNGHYAFNLLAANEFKISEKGSLNIGTKITWAGNKRYGPVDTTLTLAQGEIIYIDSERNSLQFRDYFRMDIKLNYRKNAKKITHEIGIDLVNVLNTKNILKLTYAPDANDPSSNAIREEYQLGFLPLFYYRVDF